MPDEIDVLTLVSLSNRRQPEFVAAASFTTGTTAFTSATLTLPAARAKNDIGIICSVIPVNAAQSAAGWTKLAEIQIESGVRVAWFWRRLDGTETSVTVTWDGSSRRPSVSLALYRGAEDPFAFLTNDSALASVGGPWLLPLLDAFPNGRVVYGVGTFSTTTSFNHQPGSGLTERVEALSSNGNYVTSIGDEAIADHWRQRQVAFGGVGTPSGKVGAISIVLLGSEARFATADEVVDGDVADTVTVVGGQDVKRRPVLDTFDRPNENPMTGNWARIHSSGAALQIIGNAAAGQPGSGQSRMYYTAVPVCADQEAYVTTALSKPGSSSDGDDNLELLLRLRDIDTATNNFDGYRMALGENDVIRIQRFTNGGVTTLFSTTVTSPGISLGDTLVFQAIGSWLFAWIIQAGRDEPRLLASVQDTTHASGRIGLGMRDRGGKGVRGEDFGGGELASGGGPQQSLVSDRLRDGSDLRRWYVQPGGAKSDLSGGGAEDLLLTQDASLAETGGTVFSFGGNEVKEFHFFTPPGQPGASGVSAGTWTVRVRTPTSTASPQWAIRVKLARVDAAGVVQAETAYSAGQSAPIEGPSTLSFAFTDPALGTWAAGDRLRYTVEVRRPDFASSYQLYTGGAIAGVETPWPVVDTPRNVAQTADQIDELVFTGVHDEIFTSQRLADPARTGAYVATGPVASGSGITVQAPAERQVGDLLVLVRVKRGYTGGGSPAGWTVLRTVETGGGPGGLQVAYRRADGTSADNAAIGATAFGIDMGAIACYRGVSNPVASTGLEESGSYPSGTVFTAPAVASGVGQEGLFLYAFAAVANSSNEAGYSWAAGAGGSERADAFRGFLGEAPMDLDGSTGDYQATVTCGETFARKLHCSFVVHRDYADAWEGAGETVTLEQGRMPASTEPYDDIVLATPGLVEYWRLGETGGATATGAKGVVNGTYVNTPTLGQAGAIVEDTDTAVLFNETSDSQAEHVNLGAPAALSDVLGAWTLEAWVYPVANPDGAGIITRNYNGSVVQWELGFMGLGSLTNRLQLGFFNGGSWRFITDPVTIPLNQWSHVVGTWDGTTLNLYRDGVDRVAGTPSGDPTTGSGDFYIGRRHDGAGTRDFFPGRIDEVAVYNRALSREEVEEHFYAGRRTVTGVAADDEYGQEVLADAPIAYYRLNETSGAQAADASGNDRHGTYGSAVTKDRTPATADDEASAYFPGADANSAVTLPSTVSLPLDSPVTIEFWTYVRAADIGQRSAFSIGNLNEPNRCQAHVPWSDGVLYWDYGDYQTSAGRISTSFGTAYRDKWTHVVLVSGGNLGSLKQIWLDGVKVAESTAASNGPDQAISGGQIGFEHVPGWTAWRHKGELDEFAVYDKVLSEARIQAHYAARLKKHSATDDRNTLDDQVAQGEFLDLTAELVTSILESIESGSGQIEEEFLQSQTNLLLISEALEEAFQLTGTSSNDGSVAELGDLYELVFTLVDAIVAEKILERIDVAHTLEQTIDEVGGETDPVFLAQQNVQQLVLEEVQGSVSETATLVQQLVQTLVDEIRSDIETLTLEAENVPTLLEAVDILVNTAQNAQSIDELLPVTVDTLRLIATNTQAALEDAEVVRLSQALSLDLVEYVELARLVQTNVQALAEIIDTPGPGFNEYLQLTQTSLLSLVELVYIYGADRLRLIQENIQRLVERIVSLEPPPTALNTNGVEFTPILLPYTSTTYTLAQAVDATQTTITLVDASGLPTPGGGTAAFVLVIGTETFLVTARSGNTLTVVRGWSETTAASHSAGATVSWNNYYDMAMKAPFAAAVGDWITMVDATQAYLDGQRYAWHVHEFLSVGPVGTNKLDGPQEWRSSPVVGLTDLVPGGICEPARLAQAMAVDDRVVVRYVNDVEPSGEFVLGPRILVMQFWDGVPDNVESGNSWVRYAADGTLDVNTTTAIIYDGKTTLNMTYTDPDVTLTATLPGADRHWTRPVADGGMGKSGRMLGVIVYRNGFFDVPTWSSPDWQDGEWKHMGFSHEDCMFVQIVWQYHGTPDNHNHLGPNATWSLDGWTVGEESFSSTSFAMFLAPPPPELPPGTGTPPGGTIPGGGGGGITRPPSRRIHIKKRFR